MPLRPWLPVLLAGCVSHDLGTACVTVPDAAGEPLVVTLTVAGGPPAPEDVSCEVTGAPNALTLTSFARQPVDPTPFTQQAVLILQTVDCPGPDLVEGPGTLAFGSTTLDFAVPGDGLTRCFAAGSVPEVRDDVGAAP